MQKQQKSTDLFDSIMQNIVSQEGEESDMRKTFKIHNPNKKSQISNKKSDIIAKQVYPSQIVQYPQLEDYQQVNQQQERIKQADQFGKLLLNLLDNDVDQNTLNRLTVDPNQSVKIDRKAFSQEVKATLFNQRKSIDLETKKTIKSLIQGGKVTMKSLSQVPLIPYKIRLIEVLDQVQRKIKIHKNKLFTELADDINKSIKCLIFQAKKQMVNNSESHSEIQCWCICLIVLYQELNRPCSFSRRLLKKIFFKLERQLKHLVQIFRYIEVLFYRKSMGKTDLSKRISANHRAAFFGMDKKSFANLIKQKIKIIQENYEYFGKVNNGKAQKIKIPVFNLVNVSSSMQPRKVVNILISGYLSEDQMKQQQWKDMIQVLKDNQTYCLEWQGNTIANLTKFSLGGIGQLVGTAVKFSFGGLAQLLGVLKKPARKQSLKEKIHRKIDQLNDRNPFNHAYQVAERTGKFLGELLIELFPDRFINLIGYSLATQIIQQTMKTLHVRDCQYMLNKVVLIGGVTDYREMQEVISVYKSPIELLNCYSMHDTVLKHLLKTVKPGLQPVGINELFPKDYVGHSICNFDCTDVISGHLIYQLQFKLIGKLVWIHQQ